MSVDLNKPYVPPLMVARADQVEPSAQMVSFLTPRLGPVMGLLVDRTIPLDGDASVSLILQEVGFVPIGEREMAQTPEGRVEIPRDTEVFWWGR